MAYRQSIPDQRVKIARYGNTRISQTLDTQDWKANRAAAYVNTDIGVIVNDERVNRDMASAIINLEGIRDTKQAVYQGAQFDDSAVVQNLQSRVPVDVLNEILRYAENSASDPANMKFESSYIGRNADRAPHIREDFGKAEVNHSIIESMVTVNGKTKERDVKDLREEVEMTAADQGIYLTDKNRTFIDKSDRRQQIENFQTDDRVIEESKKIANYRNAPKQREKKMSRTQWEAYKKMSKDMSNRKQMSNNFDSMQSVQKYGAVPLYDERKEVFMQHRGSMRDKGQIHADYHGGTEEGMFERDRTKLSGAKKIFHEVEVHDY
jgi:hypothetical protein